ncbi:hypothetical protein STEG23_017118, partial [Scotinomys teguina]
MSVSLHESKSHKQLLSETLALSPGTSVSFRQLKTASICFSRPLTLPSTPFCTTRGPVTFYHTIVVCDPYHRGLNLLEASNTGNEILSISKMLFTVKVKSSIAGSGTSMEKPAEEWIYRAERGKQTIPKRGKRGTTWGGTSEILKASQRVSEKYREKDGDTTLI